ncbi:hypothetical protein Anapl_04654 [Anas platyrhynchos]|uniref:Uncharacterized protein n=1 Tax=Anas platyrhynchos TaxID=8839 RepID=R0K336_ANAPL|nr:hypothetical protein Anapl_04654 [Anas platyrhynchos]
MDSCTGNRAVARAAISREHHTPEAAAAHLGAPRTGPFHWCSQVQGHRGPTTPPRPSGARGVHADVGRVAGDTRQGPLSKETRLLRFFLPACQSAAASELPGYHQPNLTEERCYRGSAPQTL